MCAFGLLTVKVRHEKVPHGSRQALAKCPLSVNGSTLTQRLLLDGFDPLFFLLRGGGRYPVHYVVSLDDASIRLRFAGLDYLTFMVGVVELKAVLKKNHETVDLHDERIREHIVCVFWIFLAVQRYLNLNEEDLFAGTGGVSYRFSRLIHEALYPEETQKNSPQYHLFICMHIILPPHKMKTIIISMCK